MRLNNFLALLRLSILPLIIFLLYSNQYIYSIVLLSIALFLEYLSGRLKKKGEITSFLDPFSQKFFTTGLLFVLFLRGEFHFFLLLFFLLRDFIVSVIKWIGARDDALIRVDFFGRMTVYFLFGVIYSILFKKFFSITSGSTFVSDKMIILFILFSLASAFLSIIHHTLVYLRKI